jgi:NADH-quinone oxidoreductase subunit J
MGLYAIAFTILSVLTIFCAVMVVVSKNPVHSVLWLVATFFTISGHYILLNAQFLAIVNIIVYAGAIMVLFLFVIMLMNLNASTESQRNVWMKLASLVSAGLLLWVLLSAVRTYSEQLGKQPQIATFNTGDIGLIENLGKVLYTQYALPFEICSVLFLSAMVGAVVIGKKN